MTTDGKTHTSSPAAGALRFLLLLSLTLVLGQGHTVGAQTPNTNRADRGGPDVVAEAEREENPATFEEETDAPSGRMRRTVSLAEVLGHSEDLMVRGDQAEITIPLRVSRRYNVQRARLRLVYVNSVALVPSRSSINVMFNGYSVRQMPLDGQNPAQVLDVELPPDRFERGYTLNKLTLQFSMHYTEDACEVPWSSDVWTQIDLAASSVALDAEPVPVLQAGQQGRLNLDSLYVFLEQAGWYPQQFHLIFPSQDPSGAGGITLNDDHLSYGSLVAQAIALRQKDRISMELSYGSAFQDNTDNFIIGTKNELSGILDPSEMSLINGPYMSIKQNTRNPDRFILIASGNTPEQVRQALTAFGLSLVRGGLPDQEFWQIEPRFYEVSEQDVLLVNSPLLSRPGSYLISSLGMGEEPYTVKGLNYGSVDLTFYLPKTFFPRPDTTAKMLLRYNTGAALGSASVVNLYVNEQFANAVELAAAQAGGRQEVGGETFFTQGRTVTLPVAMLRPGRNTISIQPRLFPETYELCEHIQVENLTFTLSEQSELILPQFEAYSQLPDLQLWSNTAFPLSSGRFGDNLSVFVTERNPEAVLSSWLLMARMVQSSGELLHRSYHSFSLQEASRQLLIVGSVDFLGNDILENAPISLPELQNNQLPMARSVEVMEEQTNWLDGVAGWFGYVRPDQVTPATASHGLVKSDRDSPPLNTSDSGIILQYQSNFGRNASIVVVTASSPNVLLRSVERLVQEKPSGLLQGDLALWHPEDGRMRVDSYRFGENYAMGSLAPTQILFFQRPTFFAILIVGVIVLFGVLTFLQLRRMSKQSR